MRQVVDRMRMSEVSICYGMTETSPVSTQTRADDAFERRVGTVGRVGPHLEIKVVDPVTGETVPRGEIGRVLHPRLQRDASATGTSRTRPRRHSTPTAGCTPVISR